jgi:hypothetical protein
MSIIGVLPASGKATRIGGLPKFALPVSDNISILKWHVQQMLEVCDEVRVSTRAVWAPLVQSMDMNVKLIIKEPSTMSDAVKFMAGSDSDTLLIGLPDTYMVGCTSNIYKKMLESKGDVILGAWDCHEEIKGRVGQIFIRSENRVVHSQDKTPNCPYPHMWGTMLLRNISSDIDPNLAHVGLQIQDWIDKGMDVRAVAPGGKYMDIGTFEGIKLLYKEMDNA